jgi:hypothetical protein
MNTSPFLWQKTIFCMNFLATEHSEMSLMTPCHGRNAKTNCSQLYCNMLNMCNILDCSAISFYAIRIRASEGGKRTSTGRVLATKGAKKCALWWTRVVERKYYCDVYILNRWKNMLPCDRVHLQENSWDLGVCACGIEYCSEWQWVVDGRSVFFNTLPMFSILILLVRE